MRKLIYKLRKKLVRSCGKDIDYKTMQKMIKENSRIIVIDVRTKDEYNNKHIQGAINIPLQDISERIGTVARNKNDIIILYCEYGGRSRKAMNKLEKLGFVNVYNLDGGIEKI